MSGYSDMPHRPLGARPAATVHLIAGRLCLDFANAVGARQPGPRGTIRIRDEKLTDYADLLAWGLHAGALTRRDAAALQRVAVQHPAEAAAVFRRAIRLREAIYRTAKRAMAHTRPRPGDLAVLNTELQIARSVRRLDWGPRAAEWRWQSQSPALDQLLWAVVESAAEFFTAADLSRLRQCGGDDCGWLFEDTSRNGRRRWCDMQDCGNVAKVRRYRARGRHA